VDCFKTGLEPGLICYQCVGTHPGTNKIIFSYPKSFGLYLCVFCNWANEDNLKICFDWWNRKVKISITADLSYTKIQYLAKVIWYLIGGYSWMV
jgi:hypothetical protein